MKFKQLKKRKLLKNSQGSIKIQWL